MHLIRRNGRQKMENFLYLIVLVPKEKKNKGTIKINPNLFFLQ
jgi:hypothetical protein